jgi:hypothetical protein
MAQRVVRVCIVLALVVGTVLFFPFYPGSFTLRLIEQEGQTVLFSETVHEGDVIVFNWIHSFEHIPWTEEYTIEADGTFLLHTITVAGFGAGIPANKGVTTVEDGMVVMRSIDERFDRFSWLHSQTALTSITIEGNIFIHGVDVEHHLPVALLVKGTENLWQRYRWTR